MPKLAISEEFHTPVKTRCNNETLDENQKCFSDSDHKLLKNVHLFLKNSNPNNKAFKFEIIIDTQYNCFYFEEDTAKKLYFEMELILKGGFIRNWESLLENACLNNIDYDLFFNLRNNFAAYKKFSNDQVLENLKNLDNSEMEMEIESENDVFQMSLMKSKQDFFEKYFNSNYLQQSLKKNKTNVNLNPVKFFFIFLLFE